MDWIACILEIIGAWMVGDKNKWGFIIFMAGNCFWLLAGKRKKLYGLMLAATIFFLINIRNFILWL